MKTVIALITALTLTGCGTYGEPLLLAQMFDRNDPCQRSPMPQWCGASAGVTVYERNYYTGRIISTYKTK
jgi:hypothetical protein